MSKRCKYCGEVNEDERIFCAACGEPLDAELRLMMDLDKAAKNPTASSAPTQRAADNDHEYVHTPMKKEKKSPIPALIAVTAIVVIALVIWLFLR